MSAFLIAESAQGDPPAAPPVGNADAGRRLVQSSGCLNCHELTLKNDFPAQAAVPAGASAKGCLAPEPASRGAAPDFGLSAGDRAALAAFVSSPAAVSAAEAPSEIAERWIAALRCNACHRRDGQDDVWTSREHELVALEPLLAAAPGADAVPYRVDQTRPSLTWAGEKLQPEWMAAFIAGEVAGKPRPWLKARMPSFPAYAPPIASGLALSHGCPPVGPPPPAPDPALAEIGRSLAGKAGGFGCAACHRIGAADTGSPFEVEGVNFMRVRSRLRKDYYDRWMRNPVRVEPGARMPQFAGDDGKTPHRDVLDGDAARQFDALWHYLMAGESIEPPGQ